jgi:hypothetical protein
MGTSRIILKLTERNVVWERELDLNITVLWDETL